MCHKKSIRCDFTTILTPPVRAILIGLVSVFALSSGFVRADEPATSTPQVAPKAPVADEEPTPAVEPPSSEESEAEMTEQEEAQALLSGTMKSLIGKEVDLADYRGKVVVVVNTASKCGFTKQYEHLEKLHQQFHEQGLAVLGFPCNEFGKQEPGTAEEIATFCKVNYGVTFDLFKKSNVNDDESNPLYAKLRAMELKPKGAGKVKWNFEKFVIGRDGVPVGRFASRVSPMDKEFLSLIEAELAKE